GRLALEFVARESMAPPDLAGGRELEALLGAGVCLGLGHNRSRDYGRAALADGPAVPFGAGCGGPCELPEPVRAPTAAAGAGGPRAAPLAASAAGGSPPARAGPPPSALPPPPVAPAAP